VHCQSTDFAQFPANPTSTTIATTVPVTGTAALAEALTAYALSATAISEACPTAVGSACRPTAVTASEPATQVPASVAASTPTFIATNGPSAAAASAAAATPIVAAIAIAAGPACVSFTRSSSRPQRWRKVCQYSTRLFKQCPHEY